VNNSKNNKRDERTWNQVLIKFQQYNREHDKTYLIHVITNNFSLHIELIAKLKKEIKEIVREKEQIFKVLHNNYNKCRNSYIEIRRRKKVTH